jgi:hypothetical protein
MKTALVPVVWLAGALLLLACCVSLGSSAGQANSQREHLLFDGKQADALLTKDAEHLTLTITAKASKRHPPDWSGLKVSASSWPHEQKFGGFFFDMALVNTNTANEKRPCAVFAFKGEPSVIEQISDITVTPGPAKDAICYFLLPLSREEVLARFRVRASKEELRRLQELRLSRDPESRERQSVEVVTDPSLGPVTVRYPWVCAAAHSADAIPEAVGVVLSNARIAASCSGNLGMCHWFAPKEQFFRARRALLAAKDPRVRACALPPPQFTFE